MRDISTPAKVFLIFALAAAVATANQEYQKLIPNGATVSYQGRSWPGLGHTSASGGGELNPFGKAFQLAGRKWTVDLCRQDSDGDGFSNGAELGDPECRWTPGATLAVIVAPSHPGFRDSIPQQQQQQQQPVAAATTTVAPRVGNVDTTKPAAVITSSSATRAPDSGAVAPPPTTAKATERVAEPTKVVAPAPTTAKASERAEAESTRAAVAATDPFTKAAAGTPAAPPPRLPESTNAVPKDAPPTETPAAAAGVATATRPAAGGAPPAPPTEAAAPPRVPTASSSSAPACNTLVPEVPTVAFLAAGADALRFAAGSADAVVEAAGRYSMCGADKSAALMYNFSATALMSTTANQPGTTSSASSSASAAVLALPSRGPKASLAGLAVGTYVVNVVASLTVGDKAALVARASVRVQIVTLPPRIVPTTATAVRVSSSSAEGTKLSFGADIVNQGANKIAWTCCKVAMGQSDSTRSVAAEQPSLCPAGTCPEFLNKLPASASIAVSSPTTLAAGSYRLTLSVGTAASAIFTIQSVEEPVLAVRLTKTFDRNRDAFVFSAFASAKEVQYSWKMNGETIGPTNADDASTLVVARSRLPEGRDTTFEVKATKGTASNSATVTVPAPLRPAVTCTVSNVDASATSIVAFQSRIRVVAIPSGFNASAVDSVTYRFGYARQMSVGSQRRAMRAMAASETDELAGLATVYLSSETSGTEVNTTAPLASTTSTTADVAFFVQLTVNKEVTVRGVCRATVTRATLATADADAMAAAERTRAKELAAAGDAAKAVRSIVNSLAVATADGSAKDNATARAGVASEAAATLADALRQARSTSSVSGATSGSSSSPATGVTDMSAETKANVVEALSSMDLTPLRVLRDDKLAVETNRRPNSTSNDAVTPADAAAAREACNATCREAMRVNVMAAVRAVLAQGADGTHVDVRSNGAQILGVLASMPADGETAAAVSDVAATLARQTPVGETATVEAAGIAVSAASFPADVAADANAGAALSTADGTTMRWPAGLAVPDAAAGSTVALTAAQSATNSFGTDGLQPNQTSAGRVTDFKVNVDGAPVNIRNLTRALRCSMKLDRRPNATLRVRYFDEAAQKWSSQGIRNVSVEADGSAVSFEVDHLTAFGSFDETPSPTAAPAPPSASSAATPAASAPATEASAAPPTPAPTAAGAGGGPATAAATPSPPSPAGPSSPPPLPPAGGSGTPSPPAAAPTTGAGGPGPLAPGPAPTPAGGGGATVSTTPATSGPSGGGSNNNNNAAPVAPADSSESGLSLGAKIGIGAGSVVLVAAVAGMFLATRRASQPSHATSEEVLLELPRQSPADAFVPRPAPAPRVDPPANMMARFPAHQQRSMLSEL